MVMDFAMIVMVMNHLHRRGGGEHNTPWRQRCGMPDFTLRLMMCVLMLAMILSIVAMLMVAIVLSIVAMLMLAMVLSIVAMLMLAMVLSIVAMPMLAMIQTQISMLMSSMMMDNKTVARMIIITFDIMFALGTAASTAHGKSPDIVKMALLLPRYGEYTLKPLPVV